MTREEDILRAAEKLFFERSFDGVGVDAIGKEAGLSGSAIYRHFDSKDEILAVLFDQATDALLLSIGTSLADPHAELDRLIRAHVEFAISHERLAGIWLREQRALTQAHRRNFLRRQRSYTERWYTALDACYPGHTHEELQTIVRALHALITSDATRPIGSAASPELKDLLTTLAVGAVSALGAS